MAKLIGNALPDDLFRYLGDGDASRYNDVMLLISLDENSYPHIALLSHWEVGSSDRTSIKVATYSDSRTTANMRRTGRVTMVLVKEGMSYYVKGDSFLLREKMEQDPYNSLFVVKVKEVYQDALEGAEILSGIKFRKDEGVEPHEPLYSELMGA